MKKLILFIVLLFISITEVSANDELEDKFNSISTNLKTIKENYNKDKYVVGSIYMSTSPTNPSDLFGGTWEAYATGRTLIGAGSTYTAGDTDGSETVTLTTENMPSHTHTYTASGSVSSTFTGTNANVDTKAVAHTHTNQWILAKNVTAGLGLSTYGGYKGRMKIYNGTSSLTLSSTTPNHSHTLTASGTVTSTFKGTNKSISSKGSSTAFSVLNPYITVYIWRKTG